MQTLRPSVCPHRSGGGARCVAPRTTLHYSLAHSLPPIPCSMLDRSKSVARVRSRPASLPPPPSAAHVVLSSSLTPPPAPPHSRSRQRRRWHATIQLRLSFQYSAMLLDCIRPESESWCQAFPESHQHASIKAFAVHRWKRDLVTLRGLRGSPFRPRPSLQYCIGDGHGLRQQYLRR